MTAPQAGLPRLLTIMGSGETAPTMVKVHRMMLDRLGPPPVPAVLLDTPFGFQENAKELAQRVVHYFAESLRADIEVASTPVSDLSGVAGPTGEERFAEERLVSSVRSARYVFAGPGSPTYALRKWSGTVVPSLLREKLRHGGGISFASAAALTLGVLTVPVYEIYKVGEDPRWLEGMDVLSETGISAAVIPHYNNAEGGTHDTRFCYLGERRLARLEEELPPDSFVLGIDEHTSLTLDLDSREAFVGGNATVTVRSRGHSRTLPTGTVTTIERLLETAEWLAAGRTSSSVAGDGSTGPPGAAAYRRVSGAPHGGPDESSSETTPGSYSGPPLIASVREQEASFSRALERRDVSGAVAAVLELDSQITQWANDIPAGDALDRARASLRSLIVELGKMGQTGARDPREVLGPYVELLLEVRHRARTDKRFDDADWVRGQLVALGVEVRDTPDGTAWLLS